MSADDKTAKAEIKGELTTFDFEGQTLRAYRDTDNFWFVANDVCEILEIKNSRDFISQLDDDEKGVVKRDTGGGVQDHNAISESGLYLATIRSNKPVARAFTRWVTKTVLPQIRRSGSYAPPGGKKHIPRDKPGDAAGLKGLDLTEYRVDRLTRETDRLEQILHDIRDSVVSRRWQVPVMLPDFGRYLVIADLGGVKIRGSMHKSFWHHDDLMMVAGLCESVDVIQRLWHQTATFVDRDHPQRELFERLSVNVDRATETAKRMKDLYEEDIKASKPFNPYFPASMD